MYERKTKCEMLEWVKNMSNVLSSLFLRFWDERKHMPFSLSLLPSLISFIT